MVKLKSAAMYHNHKEIVMKEADNESCVQLYFEILGNKYELDYFNASMEEITEAINIEYNFKDNKYALVSYEYKLVFEVEVEIDGVSNTEEFIIEAKKEDGVSVLKSTLLGTTAENLDSDDDIAEFYKELEPNVYLKINNCFQF